MGGHRPASLNSFYDDSFLNLQHFDTKLIGAAQRGRNLRPKNRPKMNFKGVKIAWVQFKKLTKNFKTEFPGNWTEIFI